MKLQRYEQPELAMVAIYFDKIEYQFYRLVDLTQAIAIFEQIKKMFS